MSLLEQTGEWASISNNIQIHISFVGVILNLLHISILSQKNLRSSAANILIIGIAISDILYPFYYVKYGIETLMNRNVPRECIPPKSFLNVIVNWVLLILRDTFRRVSLWLGIFLATIRFLVTKYPMNHTIQILMKTESSWTGFIWISLLSLLITGINNGRLVIAENKRWIPENICTMYPPNSTFPDFEIVHNLLFDNYQSQISASYLFIDAILQLIPSVLYPFLAAALLIQLKTLKNSRKVMMKKEENGETAYVILCMTIAYFLAGTPYACSEFHYSFVPSEDLGVQ
ncbi:CBN-SRW-84 protein [Caenorhabditis brenneri]|uniref:CBN-SRW-84 protein n=1 Tax=Caenorhabditis brenneri TaxID=135651 RepID=G0NER4_CAEBE|nr:CBN-SRW-84 protein [Caenorhabditis brenneri]